MNSKQIVRFVIACVALALVVTGCKKDEPKTDSPVASVMEKAGETAEAAKEMAKEELTAKLAKADAADGETDKVISKCLMCSLGMDGSDSHSVEFQGYTFHFCKEGCLTSFNKDSAKAIANLVIPGK